MARHKYLFPVKSIHWLSAVNVAARIATMVSGLLGVYCFSRLFSVADFGLWSWLLSISVIVTSQDFGFLSAMRVWLGKEMADGDELKQQLIFVAGLLAVGVVFVLMTLGVTAYGALLFKNDGLDEKNLLVIWVLLTSVFSIFGTVAATAFLAYLKSGIVGAVELVRAVMQLGVILAAFLLHWDLKLVLILYFLLFVAYVPAVMGLFLSSYQWGLKELFVIAKTRFGELVDVQKRLIKNGFLLWLNQLAYAAVLSADVFYAGVFLIEQDVVTVAVVSKLVGLGVGLMGAGLLPYFGAYVHKMAGQDVSWINQELRKAIRVIGSLGVIYLIGLLLFGEEFILAWSGFEIDSHLLFIAAGLQFTTLALLAYIQLYFQSPRLMFEVLPLVGMACIVRLGALWLCNESLGALIIFGSSVLANGVLVALLYRKLLSLVKSNRELVSLW